MGMTYDEYLKKVQGFAAEARDNAKASAASILSEAKTDADTEYERSKSTYGMLAEQMAQSGLSGSGYSDNLTREAYAARQTGYDNAFKNYNEMMRAADQKYQEGMLAAEEAALAYKEGIDQNFDLIYADIAQGTSKSDLDRYIRRYGLSKDQADMLYKKAGWSLMSQDTYNNLMGIKDTGTGGTENGDVWDNWDISTITNDPEKAKTTRDELYKLRRGGIENITKEAWDAMFNTVSGDPNSVLSWLSQEYTDEDGEAVSPTIADYLMKKGVISKGLRDKVYEWDSYEAPKGGNAKPEAATPFTTETLDGWRRNLAALTKEELDAAIKIIQANDSYGYSSALVDFLLETPTVNGLVDKSGGATVGEYLYSKGVLNAEDDLYKKFLEAKNANTVPAPESNEGAFYATGLAVKKGLNTSNKKDNFKVTDGDRTYKVQIGTKTKDATILNKAASLGDGTIFMYNGTPYIKVKTDGGQEVWSVEQKTWTDVSGQYEKFLSAANKGVGKYGTGIKIESAPLAVDGVRILPLSNAGIELTTTKGGDDAMQAAISKGAEPGEFFYDDNGDLYWLHTNRGSVWKVTEGADEFKEYYDFKKGTIPKDAFTPVTAELIGTADIGWLANNFTAKIGNTEYKIQTGERASAAVEDFVTKEGSNIPQKSLFTYNGKLYMRDKNKVYEVEARSREKYRGDYSELIKAIGI